MSRLEVAAPPSPFKGLAPFEDSALDALFFFGREHEVEVIVANLVANRLTVLYGPSGVGKTSLLRAGVARRLRQDPEATVAVVSSWAGDPVAGLLDALDAAVLADGRPAEPVRRAGSLADALATLARRLDTNVYLVLDQFEEYFLYHGGDSRPGTLMDELPEALRRSGLRANVLLGLREDALAQLDAFKSRIPNRFAHTLRLDRLDRQAGEAAIVGPVREYNRLQPPGAQMEIEPELVDAVLREVAAGAVDLGRSGRGAIEDDAGEARVEAPYLQLVLERLWAVETSRGSGRLRVETLRELGGAASIVQDHLERAMSELSPGEKDAAAAMYNHLVTPSGTKIAHRMGDLVGYAGVERADAERVLRRLAEERIVRAGENGAAGPRYEIFHDVLADAVLAWRARHEAERRLAAQHEEAERRHRRTLAFAVAAAVAVAVLAGISVYAFLQRANAREEARHARAGELAALASSQLPVDPERSLDLALAADRLERTSRTEDLLRATLRALRAEAVLPAGGPVAAAQFAAGGRLVLVAGGDEARLLRAGTGTLVRTLRHGAPLADASLSPDGTLAVTAGRDGVARLWSTRTGGPVRELRHGARLTSAAFSRDGSLLVTTGEDGAARIWDTAGGRLLQTLVHPQAVASAAFDASGQLVVTALVPAVREGVARVFDVRTGRLVSRLVQPGRVTSARFAPSGDLVLTGSGERVARLWDARSGTLRRELTGHVGAVLDAEFSGDGTRIVTASTDQTARVWDAATGALVAVLAAHTNYVLHARFSPDGESVVTASADRRATVFDTDAGAVLATLVGHGDSVTDAVFSPDGGTVLTAGADGTARLWDPLPQPRLEPLGTHRVPVASVAFSRDGGVAVTAGADGGLRIWRDGTRLMRFTGGNDAARAVALSPGGRVVAVAVAGGVVELRDTASGRLRRTLSLGGPVGALAIGPREELLFTGGADGVGRLWRVRDGQLVHELAGHRGAIVAASFSPDGDRLVTASRDRTARIWDTASGALVRVFRGHHARLTSASFSADGRLVATTSFDHDSRVWDARSGALRWVLGQAAVVNGASFSADGRWLVTAGPTAGVWDLSDGRPLYLLRPREPVLTAVAFSPTGWRIVTGGIDGSVRRYDCRLCAGASELATLAQARLQRLRR